MSITHSQTRPGLASRRHWLLTGSAAAAALVLGACAGLQPATPEQLVEQRANARWAALVDEDFEKAWEYAQPGYRAIVPQRRYHRQFRGAGNWKDAKIVDVTCESNQCTARVRLTAEVNMPRMRGQDITTYFNERWVREDGQWWFYQSF